MMTIFLVGAVAGLGASWWLRIAPVPGWSKSGTPVTVRAPIQTQAPAARPDTGQSAAVRGITPSELPYDGKPPPVDEDMPDNLVIADPVPVAPLSEPHAASLAGPAAVSPSGSRTSGGSAAEESTASETQAVDTRSAALQEAAIEPPVADEKPVNARSRSEALSSTAKKQPAAPNAPAKAKVAESEKSGTTTAQRKPAPPAKTKDREIERIKREADKELQRKLEIGRASGQGRPERELTASLRARQTSAAAVTKTAHVKKVLAKCESMSNVFRREQCKWRVCGNMWGKHGCPSYARQATTY